MTSPKKNGEAGSMSVFAPAVDIVVPGKPSVPDTGTSQAAAIVAGIAAYFYGLNDINLLHGNADRNMKDFIIDHAWQRVPEISPTENGWPPERLPVVYNLAYGDHKHADDPCSPLHRRDNSSASACSFSQNVTSATSTKSSKTTSKPASKTRSVTSQNATTKPAKSTSRGKKSASSTSDSYFEYSTTTGTWAGHYYYTETKVIVSTVRVTDISTVAPPPPPPPSSEAPPPAETTHKDKSDYQPGCVGGKRDEKGVQRRCPPFKF
ncbi:hypothetical protein P171DRAFT_276164 [Karstenula rhodostoma CBS 690.94]|uniref:Peptidase S8/S53 domain-containing protein n=1 Tax=Karstenula rhodostoma CBS 690.94 TaxID=1392251 RepID=A0A9P4UBS6_9PLEO|nr:hypothetical protein P171DRAFT_276164 [Karstenula rhodostoma CBS 690.94]